MMCEGSGGVGWMVVVVVVVVVAVGMEPITATPVTSCGELMAKLKSSSTFVPVGLDVPVA